MHNAPFMDKDIPLHLQEIIFSSSDTTLSRKISRLEKEGKLRKLAPRIYTPNLKEPAEDLIRRNIFKIIGRLYPDNLLSHRSAFEFRATATGNLFLTSTYSRNVALPGITLNLIEGPARMSQDQLFTDGLYVSHEARKFLENIQESRRPGPASKTLALPEVEEKLEQIARIKGEDGLNALRDQARETAQQLGMQNEFEKLNRLISALLTTKPSDILSSPIAIARAYGHPYDPARIALFETLFIELQQRPFASLPERNNTVKSFRNFAFYEAYFSNFIEGTKFKIEEARQIIETGKPIPARDEDSHDVLGTYQLVSNADEMERTPETPDELIEILRYRHKILLSARPHKNPGEFKTRNNQAGDSVFVDHQLVRGTLIRGFDFYRALTDPFAKAAFMMFMISEVHPFDDGNGRIARIMMNAELVKAGQTRIIIPTAYREDYLGGLRQLTRREQPDTYIRMLQRGQRFSSTITCDDIDHMQHVLEKSNAFKEGEDYILQIQEAYLP